MFHSCQFARCLYHHELFTQCNAHTLQCDRRIIWHVTPRRGFIEFARDWLWRANVSVKPVVGVMSSWSQPLKESKSPSHPPRYASSSIDVNRFGRNRALRPADGRTLLERAAALVFRSRANETVEASRTELSPFLQQIVLARHEARSEWRRTRDNCCTTRVVACSIITRRAHATVRRTYYYAATRRVR